MPITSRRHRLLLATSVIGLMVFSGVFAKQATAPTTYTALSASKSQMLANHIVTTQLSQVHYQRQRLDDNLSSVIFDRYLKELDGTRSYFLASDIKEFEVYRKALDDALQNDNLKPAFAIYNRYQLRVSERLNFVLSQLERGVASVRFDTDEALETDRENAPWAANKAELDDLWRKRLKAAELGLKLAGKKPDEIQKTLIKRYRNQLTHLYQTRSDDAFQVYMNAVTESYDPHTEYFSPRTSENFNINMSLSLEGIGAVLQSEDEYTKVVRLVTAGPADKSGQLKPGDRIVGVAQDQDEFTDVIGWRIDEVVELIRGPKGSTVRLQVLPAGAKDEHQTRIISIVRNTVALEDQAAKKQVVTVQRDGRDHKIGVITLPNFYADFQGAQNGDPNYRSTTRDVRRLLNELKQEKIEGLVLDLRNNGGGSLEEANTLVGLFIDTGPTVQIRGTRGRPEILGDTEPGVAYSGPLVVLVNRLSASASEIFAGAIQDYQRGLIVGSTTFGKGTVQALRDLNHGQLKITQAKFYRISGGSNQNKGIVPDISFPSLVDEKDIGESALPNALPWDSITPVHYQAYNDFGKTLPKLRQLHESRAANDPDFIYTEAQIALIREQKKKTELSLNEETRKAEQAAFEKKRLEIENRKRLAKGLAPLKELEKTDEDKVVDEASNEEDSSKKEDDGYLREAGHIILDWSGMIPKTASR